MARWTVGREQLETSISGLSLHRWEAPTEQASYMLAPSICLIGQGRKRLVLGEQDYIYDTNNFLITSVDLPVVTQVIEASTARPYLGLTMALDLQVIAELLLTLDDHSRAPTASDRVCLAVSAVSPLLLNAFERLLDLLDQPQDITALAPLIKQEIFYRLLTGEQGPRLRQIVTAGNHGEKISRVIDWLKKNLEKPFRVEELAATAGLSSSAFHHHFRAMTAMSPLQFQKRMRLNEARRLMLTEHLDVSSAAFKVGYESPSQFSREYSRQFGNSPLRDIKQLNQAP
ncbi:AraC family transcriptional regulator [Microbulbifer bruguierae]|uniref:AraC family transcriptional regulator n=1 Tax=Microbulbifer bruguierae TaxID=3029061 RepID=A0ABY8ND88_9GAMM|nr:AraC family transcriptional regulator [Microbulbifer bruguierae]WGL16891.1 AraC family transcriptional regulator [Microbulbifer bruguierae]